jgi:hypothetical protein
MKERTLSRASFLFFGLCVVLYACALAEPRFSNPLVYASGVHVGLTFNSMLEHLLRGQFDVDPAIIGDEAFVHDGKSYAYWGIVPALLRLPLLLLTGGKGLNVTGLSCLLAVTLAGFIKLLTLQRVFRDVRQTASTQFVYWVLAATLLLAGSQTAYLRSNIYVEVCLWAAAWGALFVYAAVRGLLDGCYSTRLLAAMALAAGLALNTRVTIGLALYVAIGLLFVVLAWQRAGERRRSLLPIAILLAFIALAAWINYERWGNPATFLDNRLYVQNAIFPDRVPRFESLGYFNPVRIPFGLVYYLAPLWAFDRGDGSLYFEAFQKRWLDMTELPPSSFLLTDGLLICFAVYALWTLLAARQALPIARGQVVAVAGGLAVAALLLLCAISMCYRYRIDFYPVLHFGAYVGLILYLPRLQALTPLRKGWLLAGAGLAIGGSFVSLLLFKLSPYGPAVEHLHRDIYGPWLQRLF